ncbi:hypothetical protein BSNK01_12190 [Bacillaceae bacterium]
MDKKKAIRMLEEHLRNYKTYKVGIKNLKKTLDDILPSITTNYTIREGTNGSFDITSKVEQAVLDRLESSRAIYLREQINVLETIVDSIDEAVEALGENEKEFVRLRYFEGYPMEKVAQEMNFSINNCFYVRRQILDSLLISLRNIVRLTIDF